MKVVTRFTQEKAVYKQIEEEKMLFDYDVSFWRTLPEMAASMSNSPIIIQVHQVHFDNLHGSIMSHRHMQQLHE